MVNPPIFVAMPAAWAVEALMSAAIFWAARAASVNPLVLASLTMLTDRIADFFFPATGFFSYLFFAASACSAMTSSMVSIHAGSSASSTLGGIPVFTASRAITLQASPW